MNWILRILYEDRIVQTVFVLSVIVLLWFIIWSYDKTITPENFYYQPILLKIFVFLNIPSVILTGLVFYPIWYWSGSPTDGRWINVLYYSCLVALYFFQWFFLGLAISRSATAIQRMK